MAQFLPTVPGIRKPSGDRSIFVCGDCKTGSPIESFIAVDSLHIQCPACLYVFFRERSGAKAL